MNLQATLVPHTLVAMGDRNRVNVELAEDVVRELERHMGVPGNSKTAVVNRALRLYLWAVDRQSEGADLVLHYPDGSIEGVKLL